MKILLNLNNRSLSLEFELVVSELLKLIVYENNWFRVLRK